MALKPVTDPNLLTALNSAPAPDPATVPGPKPVTDPALLAQLNAPEQPAAPDPLGVNEVPVPSATPAPAAPAAPQASIWEQFLNKAGLDQRDPVLDMAGHGLVAAAKGAPEVAANMVGNAGVQAVAGLTAPFAPGSSADYIEDFTVENSMRPQGASAKFLTEGLGEAFAPVENVKQGLGEGVEALGGNADAAATASMLPDFLMTLVGGPKAVKGAAELPTKVSPPQKPISPTVENLRAADIRLRPSDVRAMNPDKRVKVPGEFRERFADAPDLKADTTLHNQARFTDIAAKEIGVKGLDETSLAKAKETPAATYDMVEQALMDKPMSPEFQTVFREAAQSARLPKGEGSSVTRIIGALRRRAAKRMQNDQVATEEAGFADRELADRLEEALGKELEAVGEPQLLGEYRAARQQFAKIHDIETATRAGQIDANVVYKLGQRGTKLSGGLKLIADAAENLPNVTGHSLKTAARAGNEIPTTFMGGVTEIGKKAVRSLGVPFTDLTMDVGSSKFQNQFGKADPARASYYGKDADIAPVRGPEQGDLDLREALELDAPPGAVGAPERALREPGSQMDMLGEAFEFQRPAGEVGIPPEAQISLQELLGLGEPLAMKQPPGRVGKPKRTQ